MLNSTLTTRAVRAYSYQQRVTDASGQLVQSLDGDACGIGDSTIPEAREYFEGEYGYLTTYQSPAGLLNTVVQWTKPRANGGFVTWTVSFA